MYISLLAHTYSYSTLHIIFYRSLGHIHKNRDATEIKKINTENLVVVH